MHSFVQIVVLFVGVALGGAGAWFVLRSQLPATPTYAHQPEIDLDPLSPTPAPGPAQGPTPGPGAGEEVRLAVDELLAQNQQMLLAERQQSSAELKRAVDEMIAQAKTVLSGERAVGASELEARKSLIDQQMGTIAQRLGDFERTVHELDGRNAQHLGQLASSVATLSQTTEHLRDALANSKARGQWGERMAEDVLRLAGFQENINYVKQTAIDGARAMPDFTFTMPKGHVLYMDVKFPLSAYLRFLEAQTEAERSAHRATFVRDVRLRVKELADRDYQSTGTKPAVDYVLLFLPNETISAFIHENDPDLIEHALGRKVVLCSPLTLFAFLGVIHQAFDNFVVERTSDEILTLLGTFSQQWGKYTDSLDKVQSKFETVQKEFEQLNGARRRQLEKPLRQLEDLRQIRGLPIDTELFNVFELGA